MTRNREFSMKYVLSALICLLAFGYILFQARFVVFGPKVEITSPKEGASVAASLISVEGRAKNIAWISLNDRQIFTDEEGFWKEKLMLSPGTSIITVKTKDRFGREIEKSVRVMAN